MQDFLLAGIWAVCKRKSKNKVCGGMDLIFGVVINWIGVEVGGKWVGGRTKTKLGVYELPTELPK